jgi:1-acyl-sn-glycerol-3-phosphate acyltransferase
MSHIAIKNEQILKSNKTESTDRDSNGVAIFLKKFGITCTKICAYASNLTKKISKKLYNLRCSLIKFYSGTTQFFSWFIFWPTYNLLFKVKVNGRENLRGLTGPLIMISNHTRFYDSFLYRIIVGLFSRLIPMRFMAVVKFTDPFLNFVKKTGIIHFIYSLFGVFVVEQGLGLNKNLKRAKDILKNNGVVAMFPEGRLNRSNEILMFRRGVSALALSNHTKVLPMHISIKGGNLLKLRRGSIVVNIGKAHYLTTHSTYEDLAEELRQEVIELRG